MLDVYVPLEGAAKITDDPRRKSEYIKELLEAVGLGEKIDQELYGHLTPGLIEVQ